MFTGVTMQLVIALNKQIFFRQVVSLSCVMGIKSGRGLCPLPS